jgi:hypothetical protein
MKIKKYVFIIFILLFLGMDCFAQSAEDRVRELQGTWVAYFIENFFIYGDIDLSDPKYSHMEFVWIFDGNNLLIRTNGIVDGIFTFRIFADNILTTDENGRTEGVGYSIPDGILKINLNGSIFHFRKR